MQILCGRYRLVDDRLLVEEQLNPKNVSVKIRL